jgi:hypothetical protein
MIKVEQDLPGTEGESEEKVGEGDRVEKGPKQCMNM